MDALYVLLIFSLLLGLGFLAAFFYAQSQGQFDDSQTPALRMLFDEHDMKAQRDKAIITSIDNSKKSDAGKTSATGAHATGDAVQAKANIQGAHYGS